MRSIFAIVLILGGVLMDVHAGPADMTDQEIIKILRNLKDRSAMIYESQIEYDPKIEANVLIHNLALKAFESGEKNSIFISVKSRSRTSRTTKNGEPITRADVYLFNVHQWKKGVQKIPFVMIEEPQWTLFMEDDEPLSESNWNDIKILFTNIPD